MLLDKYINQKKKKEDSAICPKYGKTFEHIECACEKASTNCLLFFFT